VADRHSLRYQIDPGSGGSAYLGLNFAEELVLDESGCCHNADETILGRDLSDFEYQLGKGDIAHS
jgi:hypothetical protein